MNKKILLFQTRRGNSPFVTWLERLKNKEIKAKILARIDRLKLGHYGVCKKLRKGVSELKIDTGAGYRIYFAEHGDEVVILLMGGTKRTQRKDINKAIEYYEEYLERVKNET